MKIKLELLITLNLARVKKDIALKFNTLARTRHYTRRNLEKTADERIGLWDSGRRSFGPMNLVWRLGKDVGRHEVWRESFEKHIRSCLKATYKSGRKPRFGLEWNSVRKEITSCHYAKGKKKNVDFVERVCNPIFLDFYNSVEGAILMEDNAPIHTTAVAKEWRSDHGIV
ncbi:hypothetical protein G6F56_003917 [Rhizopus delemar]|nr:hypothetical protein G6F56_003917 [Rhizopus delemar]